MPAARKGRTITAPPPPDDDHFNDPGQIVPGDDDTGEQLEDITGEAEEPVDRRPPSLRGTIPTPVGAISRNTQFGLAADELNSIEQAVGQLLEKGGTVLIYRRREGETGFSYCSTVEVEHFTIETVAKVWGGGDYLLAFKNSEGKQVTRRTFSVDKRVRGTVDQQEEKKAAQEGIKVKEIMELLAQERQNQPRAERGTDMGKLMEVMQARNDSMMQLFLTMSMENTKSMMQMMATIMGNRPAGEPASKMLEVMMPLVLDVFAKKNEAPQNPLIKSIEDVKQIRELFDSGDNEGSMFDKLLAAMGPMVAQGLMQGRGQPRPPAHRLPPPVVTTDPSPSMSPVEMDPVVTTANPPPVSMNPRQSLIHQLNSFKPLLLNAAANDTDVNTYVDLLMDCTTEDELNTVREVLSAENWMEIVFANDVKVREHSQWFANLREEILNALSQNDQPAPRDNPADAEAEHPAEP